MTSKDLPNTIIHEKDISYSWDNLGRLKSATDGYGYTIGFDHDALGRTTARTGGLGTLSYEYDAAGRRTRLTHQDGFYVAYDHLVTGEVTKIRENGATSGVGVLATCAYDDLGRRTSMTRGNGTVRSYGWDAASRLTSMGEDLAGTGSDLTLGFVHNPAGQIVSNTRSSPTGDPYAWNGHYNVDRSYTANGRNQYTQAGSIVPTYDAKGNLTSAGSSTYGYTAENRLATAPGGNIGYDPLGRLSFAGSTGLMSYDGEDLTLELANASPSTVLRRYVHGPGTDEPLVWYEGSGTNDRRFLHADERGSIVAVSDGAGATISINTEYSIRGFGCRWAILPQSAWRRASSFPAPSRAARSSEPPM
jgi:YD repeat-containing protein